MIRQAEPQHGAQPTTPPLTSQASGSHTIANTHPTQFAAEPEYARKGPRLFQWFLCEWPCLKTTGLPGPDQARCAACPEADPIVITGHHARSADLTSR